MVATAVAATGREFPSFSRHQHPRPDASAAGEIALSVRRLRELRAAVLHRDPSLLLELVPRLAELQTDEAGPVRKFVAEMIGDIGSKHMEYLPNMIPCLLVFLKDETPAVARQAIKTGTFLFAKVLKHLVIQGLFSSGIDDSLKSSWEWMLKLKAAVSPVAFQPTVNEGVKLLAVRFVETTVLLYTPDPTIASDAPSEVKEDMGFNIAWLRGGHPLLNVGDLAMEASQSLGFLLEQLKYPQVKSLSTSMIIVFINSLSVIAQRRPSFYGRILPVLLSLDPSSSIIREVRIPGAFHALESAFTACLKCTHSSAEPWRARLLEALKGINAGESAENISTVAKSFSDMSKRTESVTPLEASADGSNKRSLAEDMNGMLDDGGNSSKRLRESPITDARENNEEANKRNTNSVPGDFSSSQPVAVRTGNSEAVYQLIGMFAVLAAQGEKGAGSLDILSASISTDLLAEVVMANMQHLPPARPRVDADQVLSCMGQSSSMLSADLPVLQPSSGMADGLSLSSSFPLLASLLKRINQAGDDEMPPTEDSTIASSLVGDVAPIPVSFPASASPVPPIAENTVSSAVPLDIEAVESSVPIAVGDPTSLLSGIQESSEASHTSAEPQECIGSFVSTLPADISSADPSLAQSSETRSPGSSTLEASTSQVVSSSVLASQYVLPKLVVANIDLSDTAKDRLQKEAFLRILESDEQKVSGSNARLPLLAHLGVEFPLELDPWELLQKHVLSDYLNHEGHELTLCVLNRLYRETEQDQDFLSSRTATSVYESFLLTVAENLRDMFPASDKSLGKLLCEIPYLTESVLKLLEGLCYPVSNEKQDKDLQSGDRVTQGLSAVWSLIMLRPSNRDRCLHIALQSAIHPIEEVRMKAIRLVANKLFPMASISKKIEDFASEKLSSVPEVILASESTNIEGAIPGPQKNGDVEISASRVTDLASRNQSLKDKASSLVADAQRFMSLYFALCTKKHSLLRQVFTIYGSIPEAAKQAVHQHVPILIRTIGTSRDLLGIISDPPTGSQNLLMQVLQTLTDGAAPSQDLISSVKNLYSKTKDVEVLFAVLGYLSKDEVLLVFPNIVNLPMDKFQVALSRILQGSPQSGSSLGPSEILIAIHGIDPEKEGMPLKKVMDACTACFEQRTVFTQQVLAKALNQLVEQIPLPLLFMRTVMQAISAFPALVDFVMDIMSRLVSKQIWKYPKLWVGFLKCAILTKPQSFGVLLQLPAAQLENALSKNPVLRPPLVEHASQPNIRSTLPRSTLVVLGLVQDQPQPAPQAQDQQQSAPQAQDQQQPAPQAQTSLNQAAETSSSAADVTTEAAQESSAIG